MFHVIVRSAEHPHEVTFIGSEADCNKTVLILKKYYRHDRGVYGVYSEKVLTEGTNQEYITKCLDDSIDFEYGY